MQLAYAMATQTKAGQPELMSRIKSKIPPAFEREIRRKAHAMAFDYQEKVTAELMRVARIALVEGYEITEVQRLIAEY